MRTIARKHQADPNAPHVVICGAGFGGLAAIAGLTRAGMRVGGRNRLSTLINLTYRYLSWGHGGAVIVGDEPVNPWLSSASEAVPRGRR